MQSLPDEDPPTTGNQPASELKSLRGHKKARLTRDALPQVPWSQFAGKVGDRRRPWESRQIAPADSTKESSHRNCEYGPMSGNADSPESRQKIRAQDTCKGVNDISQ